MLYLRNRNNGEIVEVNTMQEIAGVWGTDRGIYPKAAWDMAYDVKGYYHFIQKKVENGTSQFVPGYLLDESETDWHTNRGWFSKANWHKVEAVPVIDGVRQTGNELPKPDNMVPRTSEAIERALQSVRDEYIRSRKKHPGKFHSQHEGYAILLEEVNELWEEVKHPVGQDGAKDEAIQVAAMALAFILEVCE